MRATRVLIVDDSALMRALICDILENTRGIEVCGTAGSAEEARAKIRTLRPHIMTLDVEMPQTNGLEFLQEIMADRPMPVIMLSSMTQSKYGITQRAIELGAKHCIPKPIHATPEQFDQSIAHIRDTVLEAAKGLESDDNGVVHQNQPCACGFKSDGSVVAIACGNEGLASAKEILTAFPDNCPPTILVINADPSLVRRTFDPLQGTVEYELVEASEGLEVKAGRVILCFDPAYHAVVRAGEPLRIGLVDREPLDGFRPATDFLFRSLARAGVHTVGGVLVGKEGDGAKGLQLLEQSGAMIFAQKPTGLASSRRFDSVRSLGIGATVLEIDQLADWIIENTNTQAN